MKRPPWSQEKGLRRKKEAELSTEMTSLSPEGIVAEGWVTACSDGPGVMWEAAGSDRQRAVVTRETEPAVYETD